MSIGWFIIGVIAAVLYGIMSYKENGHISGQDFFAILALSGLGLFSVVFVLLSWLAYSGRLQ